MFTYIPKFNGLSEIEYSDYRNSEEREFLMTLYDRVSALDQYRLMDNDDFFMFYHDSILTVAFDICDENANLVLRSLRMDFTDTSLLMGNDETFQYVSALDRNNSDVKEYKKTEYTTIQLAEIAAQWISRELSRKIELHEWITNSFQHRCYVISDANQFISWSDSKNIPRKNLGSPTRITVVYPKTTSK